MALPQGFTQEEWDGLTDEERAALQDDAPDAAAVDSAEQKAELAAGAPEEDDDEEESAPAAKEGETAAETEGETAKPAVEEPRDQRDFAPQLPVPEARDFDKEEGDLVKKYEEGEISESDYRKALRELGVAQAEAGMSEKFNRSVKDAVWKSAQEEFLETHDQYKSRIMHGALASAISELEGTEEKPGEGANWSGRKLLEEAHKRVMKEFGQQVTTEASPAKAAAPKAPKQRTEAEARKLAPATVGDMPAADLATTGDDKFAELDRLAESNSAEYERALARLSDSELAAYIKV